MRHALRPLWAAAAAAGAACAPSAAFAAEYATVVASTPVTATVPVQRRSCSESQQFVQPAPSGAGALIGAIAGGVLGHGFGGGLGTGIGAVLGSAIGNQVELDAQGAAAMPVRQCQNVTRLEERTVGYDVMYEVNGQRYSTRMARDPGARFAVNRQPADANGTVLPVPAYDAPVATAEAAPPPAYYDPLPPPAYYAPQPYFYVAPAISIGLGYYGGRRGGRPWR